MAFTLPVASGKGCISGGANEERRVNHDTPEVAVVSSVLTQLPCSVSLLSWSERTGHGHSAVMRGGRPSTGERVCHVWGRSCEFSAGEPAAPGAGCPDFSKYGVKHACAG